MLQLGQRALTASEMDGKLFVDRTDELAAIERALGLGFSVYLHAAVGSGKTSLLRRIQATVDGSVFLNAGRLKTFEDLTSQLARDLGTDSLDGYGDDPLHPLRAAADERAAGTDARRWPIILLDDLDDALRHDLFGRYRDEVQQLPLRWVVSGRTRLKPPQDSFFEATVALGPFEGKEIADLLKRRASQATSSERAQLDSLAEQLAIILGPSTPRTVLAIARSVLLSSDPGAAVEEIRRLRNALAQVSPTARRVYDALLAVGPTHAGDEQLIDEIETTRSRIVQVLRELEAADAAFPPA